MVKDAGAARARQPRHRRDGGRRGQGRRLARGGGSGGARAGGGRRRARGDARGRRQALLAGGAGAGAARLPRRAVPPPCPAPSRSPPAWRSATARRGMGDWAIEGLRLIGVDLAGRTAASVAARRSMRIRCRRPGSIAGGARRWRRSRSGCPRATEPWLLFLHGTFSNTLGSFGPLAAQAAQWRRLEAGLPRPHPGARPPHADPQPDRECQRARRRPDRWAPSYKPQLFNSFAIARRLVAPPAWMPRRSDPPGPAADLAYVTQDQAETSVLFELSARYE